MVTKVLEAIWWIWVLALLLVLMNHSKPWCEPILGLLVGILVALCALIEIAGEFAFTSEPADTQDREI